MGGGGLEFQFVLRSWIIVCDIWWHSKFWALAAALSLIRDLSQGRKAMELGPWCWTALNLDPPPLELWSCQV